MLFLSFFLWFSYSSKCLVINNKNKLDIIQNKQNLPVFVKFYDPFCFHCQHFAPTWEQFCNKNNGEKYFTAEVNCEEFGDICLDFGVRAYPGVIWIDNFQNRQVEFKKERTIEKLTEFANQQLSYVPEKNHENSFIFEYISKESDIYRTVMDVFESYTEYNLDLYPIQSNCYHLGFYEMDISYNYTCEYNSFDPENVKSFIEKHIFPYFFVLEDYKFKKIKELKNPLILFVFGKDQNQLSNLKIKLFTLKDQLNFAYLTYPNASNTIKKSLSIPNAKRPYCIFFDPQKGKFRGSYDIVTPYELIQWITKIKDLDNGWSFLSENSSISKQNGRDKFFYLSFFLYIACIMICLVVLIRSFLCACQRKKYQLFNVSPSADYMFKI